MMTTAACNGIARLAQYSKEIIVWKGLNATVSDHGCFTVPSHGHNSVNYFTQCF